MKKTLLMLLVVVGILISVGGCSSNIGMLLSGKCTLEEFNASMRGLTRADMHDPKYRNKDGTFKSHYIIGIMKAADIINKYRTNKNTGIVVRGMTTEQVIAAKGKPKDINRTVGSWGIHEQWVYGGYCIVTKTHTRTTYLYFENGILTAYQY